MTKSEGYVSAEYLRKVAKQAEALKQRSYALMQIKAGDCVLDVGCGPGVDLPALVDRVGANGKVYAIDVDEQMLKSASEVPLSYKNVLELRKADVKALPFDAKAFNAVRAERLFQVLPSSYDTSVITGELVRVLKNNGRLVVTDTDWASASVNFSDNALERRLMNYFASVLRPNGFAGRQLTDLMTSAELNIECVEIDPIYSFTLDNSPFADWLPDEAQKAGVCSASEADRWRQELQQRVSEQRYFACVNIITVCGIKVS